MRAEIQSLTPYIRYAVIGVVISTALVMNLKKFGVTTQVFSPSEMTQLCRAVAGCKTIRLGQVFQTDGSGTTMRFDIVADRRASGGDIRAKVISGLDQLWQGKVTFFGPRFEGKIVEVRYE